MVGMECRQGLQPSRRGLCAKFFLRTKQLWDDYRPDMIYFDDTVLPFHGMTDEIGLELAAHFYNSSIQWHGRNEAVMNAKHLDPQQCKALVYDIERGKATDILPEPWQTDTCIGDWHYDRQIFEHHRYKSAATVVRMLADIVSKNGNLMLSVPLQRRRPPDSDEEKSSTASAPGSRSTAKRFTRRVPGWSLAKGRPRSFREGHFDGQTDTHKNPFTAEDIRFTQSKDGQTLYALVLEFPADGKVTVNRLANVRRIGRADWQRADGRRRQIEIHP